MSVAGTQARILVGIAGISTFIAGISPAADP
jgi:hypothetical protein